MTTPDVSTYTLQEMKLSSHCCEPELQIRVRDLDVWWRDKKILDSISVDINRGCITTLIGPSGCGKSTFLTVLNRLDEFSDDLRVTGVVELDGKNIFAKGCDLRDLRRRIGMIFQKPTPFPLSIHRNLDLPLREHGVKCAAARNRKIESALRDVGLWEEVHDRLHSSAMQLSGGQQQRLCIARALVLEPEILLMDEPCSALDPVSSRIVEELICRLRGRFTIVVVTHNLAQARRIGNYTAFFWTLERVGKLVEFSRSGELFERPRNDLTRAYVTGLSG